MALFVVQSSFVWLPLFKVNAATVANRAAQNRSVAANVFRVRVTNKYCPKFLFFVVWPSL